MRTAIAVAALAVVVAPSLASAHPVRGATPGTPFRIIDRLDSHGGVGVDLAAGGVVGDDAPEELLIFRFDLHAKVPVTESLGLFASWPLAAFTFLDDGGDPTADDEFGVGDVDVGLYFYTFLGSPRTTLVARGSFTLPTADDDLGGVLANVLGATVGRITDLLLTAPDLVALRTSLSLVHDAPGFTLRVDGGLDVPLVSTDDAVDVDHDPIIRLNAGVAIGEGPARLTLELANLANSDSLGDADDFVHQLAIGATSFSGGLIYGLSLAVLLDSVVEDDVDGVVFGVLASIAQKF